MAAIALKDKGLLPSSYGNISNFFTETEQRTRELTPSLNTSQNIGGMGTSRTSPYSIYTTPMRSSNYSALAAGQQGATNRYNALAAGQMGAKNFVPQQNQFASAMEQGSKNVYAKPAFVKPQQKPANVPPNQLGQNLLNFATSPQGRGFARGLLEASGYSTTPVSFGQALAQGMAYMTEADQADAEKKQQEFENQLKQEQLNISKAAEQRQQEVFDYEIGKTKKTQQIFQDINRADFETPEKYYEAIR